MKRMTKAQKEEAQKAALLRRVQDICSVAMQQDADPDDELVYPETICKVMTAVRHLWVGGDLWSTENDKRNLVAYFNVDEYTTPRNIMEFLYRNGVRP